MEEPSAQNREVIVTSSKSTKTNMGKTLFDMNSCRAKATGTGDLVDCLSRQQACSCGNALFFGHGIFCLHPQKKSIAENTIILEKSRYSKNNQD